VRVTLPFFQSRVVTKIKEQKHKMRVLLNSTLKFAQKEANLKKYISYIKPKGIAYKFKPKKMPHPPSPWSRKVGQAKVF
jgi:hypothetical protein